MEFKRLYQKYSGMREPAFTLTVNQKSLHSCEDARLETLECELTCRSRAGMLLVQAALNPAGVHGAAWLDAFQPGAACALSVGYGTEKTCVFTGTVFETSWEDPLGGECLRLEAICMDACGLLSCSSMADAGAARTMTQLVNTILGQPACRGLAKTVKRFPADWDLPVYRCGDSDFAVLRAAAEFACYEFYIYASELYFGPPRQNKEVSVAFSGIDGLISLKRRRTLAGQCASVTVTGADDTGTRISYAKKRSQDGGFGAGSVKKALSGTMFQPEAAVHTMAQAQYLAGARMAKREHEGNLLSGRCVGLPEIRPGRFLSLSGLSAPVNGKYYVVSVRHRMDETGFETSFEAEGI